MTKDINKLSITLNNKTDIELVDLTQSLLSLSCEYTKFSLEKCNTTVDKKEAKLYVKEIKNGSIIVDLVTKHPEQMGFMLDPNIIEFGKFIVKVLDSYLRGSFPDQIDKKDIKNISSFIEPTCKDSSSQVNIIAEKGSSVVINQTFSSNDTNAIQNRMNEHLNELEKEQQNTYPEVALVFTQTKNDPRSKTDYGVISEIESEKPYKLYIPENIKNKILSDNENIFKQVFIVDVIVIKKEDKICLYKITELRSSERI